MQLALIRMAISDSQANIRDLKLTLKAAIMMYWFVILVLQKELWIHSVI